MKIQMQRVRKGTKQKRCNLSARCSGLCGDYDSFIVPVVSDSTKQDPIMTAVITGRRTKPGTQSQGRHITQIRL